MGEHLPPSSEIGSLGEHPGSEVSALRNRVRQAEEARREVAALRSAILDAALDCIIVATDDSRIVEWNPAAERTFGYTREQALGKDLAELIIPPELREQHYRGMAHYLATGHGAVLGRRVELEALRADGSRFPVELAISAVHFAEKVHFTAYLRDLTERNRAEVSLRENEQRLQATYEHAFVGIGEVDKRGQFLRVNEQLCSICGYTPEELFKRTFWDLTHPDDRQADLEQFSQQMIGKKYVYTLEKRYIHKHGHIVWVEVAASRVDDPSGKPLYGIRVVRDISDRKQAEEHQQLLINELNHRVKNTLATVQSIASQTLRTAATLEKANEAIQNRLLALSRAHNVLTQQNWEGAYLRDIIAEAIEPYRNQGQSSIHWSGPEIQLSPRMALALSMAIHELATNAVKYGALSNGTGEVRIMWLTDHTSSPPRLLLRWEEKGGPTVEPPTRAGFGSRLIERSLAQDLNGKVKIDYASTGVICTVDAPVLP
jgi:PAS domain S-box-containing protein